MLIVFSAILGITIINLIAKTIYDKKNQED